MAEGRYIVMAYEQQGAAPVNGDPLIAARPLVWNGTTQEHIIDTQGKVDVDLEPTVTQTYQNIADEQYYGAVV